MGDIKKMAILGASSGLAQAVARLLAEQGHELTLVARNESKLAQVTDDLQTRGAKTQSIVCDFDDLDGHAALVEQLSNCDEVYCFFGTLPDQEACEQDWEQTQQALHTNFISVVSILNRLANIFEQRRSGNLVVVSSVAGDRGRKSNYIYGAAKGALSTYCAGLRNRLAGAGVHVLTVKPGFIDTPMTAHLEKKPAPLWVGPDRVGADIVRAAQKRKNELYSPWFWRYILLIIRHIPEFIFKRLSL